MTAPDRLPSALRKIAAEFSLPKSGMRKFIKDFHGEMDKGLAGRAGSLKMLPAYVDRPTGNEKGSFIALDLGGTNFRVLELELKGGGVVSEPKVIKFALSREIMTGDGKTLFAFLASSVKKFLASESFDVADGFGLGFTFSFPVRQESLTCGRLVVWTKGFSAGGVVGQDVVRLLDEALAREGLAGIKVSALANDTVGTLVARAYGDSCCDVGVIIGTGTNACYAEEVSKIRKYKGPSGRSGLMIVNIEWGNFNKLKLTSYDRSLDKYSSNPRTQLLEKMVSGMYLGEIVRLVMTSLADRGLLFKGLDRRSLEGAGSFKTEYVTDIEKPGTRSVLAAVEEVLSNIGIREPSHYDIMAVRDICRLVSARAARISAAAIAAVVTKIDPRLSKNHTVAIDGSVYEKNPVFSANIDSALREVFGRKASRIKVVLSKDGSGKGAAIIAAVAASGKR